MNDLPSPFPDSPRVHYTKNPLIEVIAQLRYPSILRIDAEVPARFQDLIRETFPLFSEEESTPLVDLPPDLSQIIKTSLQQQLPRKAWRFATEDATWAVTLTRSAFSLSTSSYRRWEEFRDRFATLLGALQAEYKPSFISRIGLRYQNLIVRSSLAIDDIPWSHLLQPHIAAELSCPDLLPAIQEVVHRVLIDIADGKVNLRHGTAVMEGKDEPLYLIDNDFFTDDKTEVASVLGRLDHFNRESGRLFRWCITERLHDAMGPNHDAGTSGVERAGP